MENLKQEGAGPKRGISLPFSIVFATVVLTGGWVYTTGLRVTQPPAVTQISDEAGDALEGTVLPAGGVELPVQWRDIGRRLVASGVIDKEKFLEIYADRGGLTDEESQLLDGEVSGNLRITQQNAGMLLNLLWAFGLANKNPVLTDGPMVDEAYGGAGNFASTGGWTIARGDAMEHYAAHEFVTLTPAQQQMVERVAKGIYRPCCGNSTYFPDCNHGMAMLGLLELMAAQGVSESDMYRAALAVNSFWFPDTYLTIATYMQHRGTAWKNVDPKDALGADFSSATGYRRVMQEVAPPQKRSGGSCGV
ncbi:MAG: hypothetical protein HYW56_02535 [Candidatus Harrisonbacteria bacterium]|nr:hypothetical protein [Candidatus Harrisonbacteria bacterium]